MPTRSCDGLATALALFLLCHFALQNKKPAHGGLILGTPIPSLGYLAFVYLLMTALPLRCGDNTIYCGFVNTPLLGVVVLPYKARTVSRISA